MLRRSLIASALLLSSPSSAARQEAHAAHARPASSLRAPSLSASSLGVVRGITIGPIENTYHPNVGYGSPAFDRTLVECTQLGATWIALTPFGRVNDLSGVGVDMGFEAPFAKNKADLRRAIAMAHAHGLRVMIVPHLWVESGEWRGKLAPDGDAGWRRWAQSYRAFVLRWAAVAEEAGAEMFSVGVELRTWVTTPRAPSFVPIIHAIRRTYHGLLTYSANWDDVSDTAILGELDVIGINAFYPLGEKDGASEAALWQGGEQVRAKVHTLAERWRKPVMFTEMGYTTRANPAIRPWEWPDAMKNVAVDEEAQASAYRALLGPMIDEPLFAGFFVWRYYSDPDDVSQEAPWGFSPRGKLAETVLRDAFKHRWAGDGAATPLRKLKPLHH